MQIISYLFAPLYLGYIGSHTYICRSGLFLVHRLSGSRLVDVHHPVKVVEWNLPLHISVSFACFTKFKVDVPVNSLDELEDKDMVFSLANETVLHGLFTSALSGTVKVRGCEPDEKLNQ